MATIFSKIIRGEIPSYKIAEDDRFYAFLDINPLSRGHALVVPKVEVDYIFDLDDDLYRDMWLFAKKLGNVIESIVTCKRIGLIVMGLEVPHAHIHIIPMNSEADMNFRNPRVDLSQEEFSGLANQILEGFNKEYQ